MVLDPFFHRQPNALATETYIEIGPTESKKRNQSRVGQYVLDPKYVRRERVKGKKLRDLTDYAYLEWVRQASNASKSFR